MIMKHISNKRTESQDDALTQQQYAKLREIFIKVLDLPFNEQVVVLDRVCKEDSELKKQINELLAINKAIRDHEMR